MPSQGIHAIISFANHWNWKSVKMTNYLLSEKEGPAYLILGYSSSVQLSIQQLIGHFEAEANYSISF
jgi:hypothetical protein